MDRVTFGNRSAPFLANETVKQCVRDHGGDNKEAMDTLDRDLYVDDLMSSAVETETAVKRAQGAASILRKGDFHLKKWTSNDPGFREAIGATQDKRDITPVPADGADVA